MRKIWLTLAMLLGVLMCVAGVATVLATGLDLRWGTIGLAVALAGGALLAFLARRPRTVGGEGSFPAQRSHPLPQREPPRPSAFGRGKEDRKI